MARRDNPEYQEFSKKFAKDKRVSVNVSVEIPEREFDILVTYSRGLSMNQICFEQGLHFTTVNAIIRANLAKLTKNR
jgi:DNA-binding NarL/FixJ family response regulator